VLYLIATAGLLIRPTGIVWEGMTMSLAVAKKGAITSTGRLLGGRLWLRSQYR